VRGSSEVSMAAREGAIFAGPVGARPRMLSSGHWTLGCENEPTYFLEE